MNITILTEGKKYLSFDTENTFGYGPSTDIFQFFEKFFDSWYTSAVDHDPEVEEMYYGEDAIYTKRGAVQQAIETFAEIAEDDPTKTFYTEKEVSNADVECAFEN